MQLTANFMEGNVQTSWNELVVCINFVGSYLVKRFSLTTLLDRVNNNIRNEGKYAQIQLLEVSHAHRVALLWSSKVSLRDFLFW